MPYTESVQASPDLPAGAAHALDPGERLPVVVGELVGGKYFVERILGVGGMGIVAEANHEELQQRVALKVMRSSRRTPHSVDRFLREARAAVRLKSAHVAKILDVGTLDSGLPFMVMELLVGDDLCNLLQRNRAAPIDLAVDYVLQACDAIAEAHTLGIVHRDLKPENLFLTTSWDGTPLLKVLDFGISKITASENEGESPDGSRSITHESTVMGSPLYMSPEQVRSAKHVDARTDIWSLGTILFELVTGEQPFSAPTVADIFVKVLEKPPPRPSGIRADIPTELEAVILRCLAKDRNARFQSVEELACALEPLRRRIPTPRVPWEPSIVVTTELGESGEFPTPPISDAPLAASLETRTPSPTVVLRPRMPVVRLHLVVFGAALVGLSYVGSQVLAARYAKRMASRTESAVTVSQIASEAAPAALPTPSPLETPTPVLSATSSVETPLPAAASAEAPAAPSASPPRPRVRPSRSVSRPAPRTSPTPAPSGEDPAPAPKHQRTEW